MTLHQSVGGCQQLQRLLNAKQQLLSPSNQTMIHHTATGQSVAAAASAAAAAAAGVQAEIQPVPSLHLASSASGGLRVSRSNPCSGRGSSSASRHGTSRHVTSRHVTSRHVTSRRERPARVGHVTDRTAESTTCPVQHRRSCTLDTQETLHGEPPLSVPAEATGWEEEERGCGSALRLISTSVALQPPCSPSWGAGEGGHPSRTLLHPFLSRGSEGKTETLGHPSPPPREVMMRSGW